MLTIICGEDVESSRSYFSSLIKQYMLKGYEIREVKFENIAQINRWLADSPTLFSQKNIFFSENLNKKIRKDNKGIIEELIKINNNKEIELIDWENVSARDLKIKKIGQVKEFKPKDSIFKLLDALYPSNRQTFIRLMHILVKDMDPNFIFSMLAKHTRNLILAKSDVIPPRVQSWQFYKLKSQAKYWKLENLVNFYEALAKIDIGLKTDSPYTVFESLDILACHFL